MSINRRMNEEDMVRVDNGTVLNCKVNEITPFAATWVDIEIIVLSEVSQKEKDKYHMTSLICGI